MAESQKKGLKRMRSETGVMSKKSSLAQVLYLLVCTSMLGADKLNGSVRAGTVQGEMYEKWKKRTRREIGGSGDDADSRPMPNVKVNTKVKDELRSADQIRKMKASKENMKTKNMQKDKRGKMEASQRRKKKANQEKYGNSKVNHSGMSRRSKLIVRV